MVRSASPADRLGKAFSPRNFGSAISMLRSWLPALERPPCWCSAPPGARACSWSTIPATPMSSRPVSRTAPYPSLSLSLSLSVVAEGACTTAESYCIGRSTPASRSPFPVQRSGTLPCRCALVLASARFSMPVGDVREVSAAGSTMIYPGVRAGLNQPQLPPAELRIDASGLTLVGSTRSLGRCEGHGEFRGSGVRRETERGTGTFQLCA